MTMKYDKKNYLTSEEDRLRNRTIRNLNVSRENVCRAIWGICVFSMAKIRCHLWD